jgi:hypothetical protein
VGKSKVGNLKPVHGLPGVDRGAGVSRVTGGIGEAVGEGSGVLDDSDGVAMGTGEELG